MTAPLAAPAPPRACPHIPPCPPADAPDHDAAHVVSHDYGIGVSRLCNGVLLWSDTGELIPDDGPTGCHAERPHRPGVPHCTDPSHGHACPCVNEES